MGDYKIKFSAHISEGFRAVIAFFLFSALLGMGIQFLFSNGTFIWQDFFVKNYAVWFGDLGVIFSLVSFEEKTVTILHFLSGWYYMLYSISIIALLWNVISWVTTFRLDILKKFKIKEIPDINEMIKDNKKPVQ